MRPNVLSISPYAVADIDAVATAQTPAAGGIQALTIDGVFASGGVATMDEHRQVVFTFAADESARTFIVRGTSRKGNLRVEAVAGAAALATTVQGFSTVTEILIDDDSAGAISVGTATIVQTDWFPLDYIISDFKVALGLVFSGALTPSFDVQVTLSNLLSPRGNDPQPTVNSWFGSEFGLIFPTANVQDHDTLVAVVADATGNLAFPVRAIRLQSNQVFTVDPVIMEIVQSGHTGR